MEYQIGDFATITRLGIKTLRYYHEIGLLIPSRVEQSSGYRYYDEACLERVRMIQKMKSLQFSLSEISEILDGNNEPSAIQEKMQQKLCEIEQQIEHFSEVRQRLTALMQNQTDVHLLPNPIETKTLTDQLIASHRFVGPFHGINEKISLLMESCDKVASGPPFSLYYDDHPTEDENDIEICIPVKQPVENEMIHSRMLNGGKAICILHEGYYDQISISYQALVDATQKRHLTIKYPTREIYLVGGNACNAEVSRIYRTEIQFVIE